MFKLSWDSQFQIADLDVAEKDDPFKDCPFIKLERMRMEEVSNLVAPQCNSPRGYKEIFKEKQEPLENSLREGWWSHSWLIPLLGGVYFDRRHTTKTVEKLVLERKINITTGIPVADYKRVNVPSEPLISDFNDQSMIQMLGILGNVLKADDDAKGLHFFNTIVAIIDREDRLIGDPELKTKEFIRRLLKYMGAYKRFSDATGYVSTTLTNKIYKHVNGETQATAAGKLTFNVEKDDVDRFMHESDDWLPHNQHDDNYEYRKYNIDTTKDYYRLVVDKIMYQVHAFENIARNSPDDPHRTLKCILNCQNADKFNAAHAPNIESARNKFISWINRSYYSSQENITNNFKESFGKYYEENIRLLSDYKLELYFLPQIEDEDPDVAIQVDFDMESSKYDALKEEFE